MKLVNDSLNVDYGHLPPSRRLGYRIPHFPTLNKRSLL
nr:MAG TPA: hypothetical protein [Caudoviricetes sp.]